MITMINAYRVQLQFINPSEPIVATVATASTNAIYKQALVGEADHCHLQSQ